MLEPERLRQAILPVAKRLLGASIQVEPRGSQTKMSKPGRKVKKANHGKRPANAKARKSKSKAIRT